MCCCLCADDNADQDDYDDVYNYGTLSIICADYSNDADHFDYDDNADQTKILVVVIMIMMLTITLEWWRVQG